MRIRTLLLIAGTLSAVCACTDSGAQAPRLGTIDFPTSGSAAAKPHFVRGVLFLHSFEYDSAAAEFRRAQGADRNFALAYWGEAMTHTHPVWNEQDLASARSILNRLAPSPEERKAKAPTHREQMYLDAVEILYGDGAKPRRDTLYSAAMKRIVDAHPEDDEAQAFYALSLLGLNQGVRDIPTYLRAGEIAERVFKSNRDHPGAAHYTIHAYDDPANASRGLDAARAYSKIAPGAAHAQHMTTHIFLAMGMWDDVVSQNEIASGHDHDSWMPGHYTSWLHYAYLQQGRYADALHMMERMLPKASKSTMQRQLWSLSEMRARYIIETEQWDSAPAKWTASEAPPPSGAGGFWSFVSGLSAAKRGDVAAARKSLDMIPAGGNDADAVARMELEALVFLMEGKKEDAIALMRKATAREDAMPVDFGPPVVIKPSHELLGEMLLELGMAGEAEKEFARALELAPKRARSLLGLVRAAQVTGDSAGAEKARAELRAVWHRADAGLKLP